jgi:hypothetical protein
MGLLPNFRQTGAGLDVLGPSGFARPLLADHELARQVRQILAPPVRSRRRIWEFATHLHCSIIGTCLSTGELRQVLLKLGRSEAAGATEHDLHASGVLIAAKQQDGGKLLHKALDRRHRVAINRFDRAKTAPELRGLWQEAVQAGDIPGAYWAVLTHPATDDGLVREVFAEVHMLSHLVGAANRADIRRLRQLETERALLEAKIARQQGQLRDAVVAREATIRELRRVIEARVVEARVVEAQVAHSREAVSGEAEAVWESLAVDLKRRLATAEARCERRGRQLDECRSALAAERDAKAAAEQGRDALRRELDAVEASLARTMEPSDEASPALDLTVLYVGGRPALIGHLRVFAERSGAIFLYHDGGIEERGGLLAGLVSRADAVLFPVDCISHAAMSLVKRLCRQAGKPFLPLRSAALAPFCAALRDRQALLSSSPGGGSVGGGSVGGGSVGGG